MILTIETVLNDAIFKEVKLNLAFMIFNAKEGKQPSSIK